MGEDPGAAEAGTGRFHLQPCDMDPRVKHEDDDEKNI
jgi:hypothetical protein